MQDPISGPVVMTLGYNDFSCYCLSLGGAVIIPTGTENWKNNNPAKDGSKIQDHARKDEFLMRCISWSGRCLNLIEFIIRGTASNF